MAFLSRSFLKRLALASLLLPFIYAVSLPVLPAGAQDVQTYTDQAVPSAPVPQYDRYNSPLKAGQMTLQDVLNAHAQPKPSAAPLLPPIVQPGSAAAQPPLMAPTAQASSTNSMLMQGMQSVLQGSATSGSALQAPQIPATTNVAAMPAPVDVSVAPGVKFEPGQQPKNLAGETTTPVVEPGEPVAAVAPSGEDMTPATEPVVETPVAEAPVVPPAPISKKSKNKTSTAAAASTVAPVSEATAHCQPHVENWTKTCVEAGYPESFTGKITGETRTVCPDNSLQDVWIANSCAPPEEGGATTAAAPVGDVTNDTTAAVAAPRASTVARNSPVRADAGCGSSNGLAASSAPVSDLCTFGDASEVSGDGPWRWNCKGLSGGMTVSCAAPVTAAATASKTASVATPSSTKPDRSMTAGAAEDGLCGSSDGMGTDHPPGANLCVKGAASRVNGSGPWTWACSGENGGAAAACSASRKVDGVCGLAGKTGSDQMPMNNLCTAGFASAVTGDGPWNWTCSGLYGGNPVTCSAAPKKDAVCGGASLAGHRETPKDNLCSVGDAGSVHGSGPWTWNCNGSNGGSPVACTAPISVSGICGNSNGVAASKAPSDELCSHGTATRVTGSGPWSWNCSGSDGGDTQGCTAPMVSRQQQQMSSAQAEEPVAAATVASMAPASSSSQASSLCGSASELMALEAPDKDLCTSGKASDISGNGPWSWTCDDDGRTSNCSTLSPMGSLSDAAPKAKSASKSRSVAAPAAPVENVMANCGFAAGQGLAQAPVDGLCSVGKASSVRGTGPWHWTCVKDKTKATCDAPKLLDGACGIANGSVQKFAPVKGLCSEGSATDVQGTGPWLWTCVGAGGGSSISCSATAQSQTRVDGSCGVASNNAAISTPDTNLCDSGVPSSVYGDGPWTWTCSGLNGGIATSCSAQKNTPAAPPPPGPAVNGLCGNSNGVAMVAEPVEELCIGGTATAVSGNGPWNWNCLGSNGGMTVSCTAPLQPPAPITGVCGSGNGVPTLTTPRSGLCSAGISSAVSGKGPWTWSCSGTNGGGAVGCVAPLAGTDGGSLPSLSSTPSSSEAPTPMAAPMHPVTSSGLVTPRLQSGMLPPKTASLPKAPPSSFSGAPPQATLSPPPPQFGSDGMDAPVTPNLPDDAEPLTPPPIRDTLAPSPALKPPAIDNEGNVIPGNHFTLSSDVSTIPFAHASENIDPDSTAVLDKLSAILQANSSVRITLTAYAKNTDGTSPREARRLSLSRALVIRDYLTAKGISSGRIDVRALGANTPDDMTLRDKVDIKAN